MSVWVATVRKGIAYHRYDPMDRRTPCGRRLHIGEKGRLVFGHVLGLDVAQGKGMTACEQCYSVEAEPGDGA